MNVGGVDGQTPIDPDQTDGLLVPVATRAGLDAVEAANIAEALRWRTVRAPTVDTVLQQRFVTELHRRMFGRVWGWAGSYRRTDTNLGVAWFEIPTSIRLLLADARAWVDHGREPDECAVAWSHRPVAVHPFPNGNGRHSRLAGDCLAVALGRPVFSWGAGSATARADYLAALRAADRGDLAPLVAFARS